MSLRADCAARYVPPQSCGQQTSHRHWAAVENRAHLEALAAVARHQAGCPSPERCPCHSTALPAAVKRPADTESCKTRWQPRVNAGEVPLSGCHRSCCLLPLNHAAAAKLHNLAFCFICCCATLLSVLEMVRPQQTSHPIQLAAACKKTLLGELRLSYTCTLAEAASKVSKTFCFGVYIMLPQLHVTPHTQNADKYPLAQPC